MKTIDKLIEQLSDDQKFIVNKLANGWNVVRHSDKLIRLERDELDNQYVYSYNDYLILYSLGLVGEMI